MAFQWTYPDPLDPETYPTLIHGRLRNEIFSYKIYLQELQNAVDTLRQNIDIPAYNNWESVQDDPLSGEARTLTAQMYLQLKNKIDELLPYYGYENGVIDILHRDWSSYYTTKSYSGNDHVAPYQLLQDFRDVLDALLVRMEQWIITGNYLYPDGIDTPFLINQETNEDTYGVDNGWQEGAYKEVFVIGDLGTWLVKAFDGQTNHSTAKKWGYPNEDGDVEFDVSYSPAQSDSELIIDLTGYYEEEGVVYSSGTVLQYWEYDSEGNVTILDPPRVVYTGYTVTLSNESYLSPFSMKCGWTGNSNDANYNSQGDFNNIIDMTENSVFKLDMELSGSNAFVSNSAFSFGSRTTYLTLYMRLLFSKFIKDVDHEVIDKDVTTPPASPSINDKYLVLSGDIGTDWFGHTDEIATWNGSNWTFTSPSTDLKVKTLDDSKYYLYELGNWSEQDLNGGTEIVDIVFTNDSTFPTDQEWLVYSFANFDAYIPFDLMTFRNYYSGIEQEYNTRDYEYRWIGIVFTKGRTIASLGSYQEGTSTYGQSGTAPSMRLAINKIGIVEVI